MEKHPYPEDYAKASEHLRLALSLLSRHKIPPSPLNYQIGYECVAGRNQLLENEFEGLLEQSDTPTQEDLWELHRQFFMQNEKALQMIRQELREIIASIQGEFQRSGGTLQEYTRTLNHFADILDKPLPPETMSSEVQKVIDDTQEVEQSQNRVESQISSILSDMESMRQELEQVKEESKTDSLTGLSNRKAFDAALEHTVHSAREQRSTFCVLLGDIDHFKQFNDTYGHLVGDKVLRFVASALKRCTKGKDFVARFGGEEFSIILPQTDMSGGKIVAEQIRNAVSTGSLKNNQSGESYGRITMSVGVGQYRSDDLPNNLIQRADSALYLAKERGRNRVEQAI